MENEDFNDVYDEGYISGFNSVIVVLVTKGKREDMEDLYIKKFDNKANAQSFIDQIDTGPQKYWTKARIVEDNEFVNPSYDWY